jgi:hypothetical protein
MRISSYLFIALCTLTVDAQLVDNISIDLSALSYRKVRVSSFSTASDLKSGPGLSGEIGVLMSHNFNDKQKLSVGIGLTSIPMNLRYSISTDNDTLFTSQVNRYDEIENHIYQYNGIVITVPIMFQNKVTIKDKHDLFLGWGLKYSEFAPYAASIQIVGQHYVTDPDDSQGHRVFGMAVYQQKPRRLDLIYRATYIPNKKRNHMEYYVCGQLAFSKFSIGQYEFSNIGNPDFGQLGKSTTNVGVGASYVFNRKKDWPIEE